MSHQPSAISHLSSVACLGCGCACDDIEVEVRGGRLAEVKHACDLGVAWFGNGVVPVRVRIAGQDAALERALDAAAQLIKEATRPLVYVAPDVSCEGQREGVALADAIRAVLDNVTSATAMAGVLTAQERGRASATLGEIRNRADVIVFWGVDPAVRYPRYGTRYGPDSIGVHVPEGRRSRTVVAVDIGRRRGPADADRRIDIPEEHEVGILTAATALVSAGANGTRRSPGSWTQAAELTALLVASRYAVLVVDGEPGEGGSGSAFDAGRMAALTALTQALNGPTRCALSVLRAGGNRSGAEAVFTSQTGYPAAVDFARGYPRYLPYDGTAGTRLADGRIDFALIIGSADLIPADVLSGIASKPCAVIGPRASDSALAARAIVIDTGVAGVHEAGTALRMDDVPVPLRVLVSGPPETFRVLRALRERVARG